MFGCIGIFRGHWGNVIMAIPLREIWYEFRNNPFELIATDVTYLLSPFNVATSVLIFNISKS